MASGDTSGNLAEIVRTRKVGGMGERTCHKEETYNKCGDAAWQVGLLAMEYHGNFARLGICQIPGGSSVIGGRFLYTLKTNLLKDGYAKKSIFGRKSKIGRSLFRARFSNFRGGRIGASLYYRI